MKELEGKLRWEKNVKKKVKDGFAKLKQFNKSKIKLDRAHKPSSESHH